VPRRPRLDGLSEAPPAVHTVRGPVEPADLGRVLMHEHLVCDVYRVTGVLDHVLNDVALAIEELAPARAAGVTALVECTTVDMGRDVAALERISAASGVHVVAGTGWYRQPFYPPEIDRLRVEDLADIMVGELVDGIAGGGRAGVIGEIGAHLDYLTAQEERVLRAAARAHRVTGAPITTHASMYPVGVEQVRILEQEGVDPAKVVVGHCDTYLDRAYHERLLAWGAYVQFDTIARHHMNPDARRAEALVRAARGRVGEAAAAVERSLPPVRSRRVRWTRLRGHGDDVLRPPPRPGCASAGPRPDDDRQPALGPGLVRAAAGGVAERRPSRTVRSTWRPGSRCSSKRFNAAAGSRSSSTLGCVRSRRIDIGLNRFKVGHP
jgi:phosphotriesterase-related protein